MKRKNINDNNEENRIMLTYVFDSTLIFEEIKEP